MKNAKHLLNEVQNFKFTHIDKIILTARTTDLKELLNPDLRKYELFRHEKAIKRPLYIIYKSKVVTKNILRHTKHTTPHRLSRTEINLNELTKVDTVFNIIGLKKYRNKNYIIDEKYFYDKKFQNIKNGIILSEPGYLKLILNSDEKPETQIKEAIKDCIEKGYFICTLTEKNIDLVYGYFSLTEIEFNIFFNDKRIFEILKKYNFFSYDTSAYLWINSYSELYSYNITAKNEKRDINLNTDLFKIELRLKRQPIYELLKKNPELRELSVNDFVKWFLDFLNNNRDRKDSLSQKTYKAIIQPFKELYFDERMFNYLNREKPKRSLKAEL